MTKKRLFLHIKNSKISWEMHVKCAAKTCVFYAKKLRVIFPAPFARVQEFYWTFNEEVAITSRFYNLISLPIACAFYRPELKI